MHTRSRNQIYPVSDTLVAVGVRYSHAQMRRHRFFPLERNGAHEKQCRPSIPMLRYARSSADPLYPSDLRPHRCSPVECNARHKEQCRPSIAMHRPVFSVESAGSVEHSDCPRRTVRDRRRTGSQDSPQNYRKRHYRRVLAAGGGRSLARRRNTRNHSPHDPAGHVTPTRSLPQPGSIGSTRLRRRLRPGTAPLNLALYVEPGSTRRYRPPTAPRCSVPALPHRSTPPPASPTGGLPDRNQEVGSCLASGATSVPVGPRRRDSGPPDARDQLREGEGGSRITDVALCDQPFQRM